MNMLQRLPGNVLRITRIMPDASRRVRLVPSASIVCVTVDDVSIHIDYVHDSWDKLEFPTKEVLKFNVKILEDYLGDQPYASLERGASYWSQPVSDYPLLE